MATMQDLPMLRLPVPTDLRWKGRWIDNGPLSNMSPGEAVVRFRLVTSQLVEPAYVAAKAPDAAVPAGDGSGRMIAFHERVAECDVRRVKGLGKPKARGGLIDVRPDWEMVCIGAMASFLAQKFAPGTREATWLIARDPAALVEFNNCGDQRFGAAFRDGEQVATGRNALGLLLQIGRRRLLQDRLLPSAPEADWASLQAALVPAMAQIAQPKRGRPASAAA